MLQVASTSWFMNFLEMAGVKLEDIDVVMEQIAGDLHIYLTSMENLYL